VRDIEIQQIAALLPRKGSILEIGAGTGRQASTLRQAGFDILPIELASSNYASQRVIPVLDYDGRTLPMADGAAAAVFSSNVLEHVDDLHHMHAEIRRVLRPGGYAVHVLPTPAWRFWTTLTSYGAAVQAAVALAPELLPRSLRRDELTRVARAWDTLIRRCGRLCLPCRHGERGNTMTEMCYFTAAWWRRNFADAGFMVVDDHPAGLFYSGYMLFGMRISISRRRALAPYFGSACRIYVVRPK
jgi:SAM-dependent methyltransferase